MGYMTSRHRRLTFPTMPPLDWRLGARVPRLAGPLFFSAACSALRADRHGRPLVLHPDVYAVTRQAFWIDPHRPRSRRGGDGYSKQ